NRTKAEEQETSRLVHETHKRLVTKKSTAAVLEEAQMKKAIKLSKRDTSFHHQTGGSSEGADDEEYDHINEEMYDDVNVELKDAELVDEGKGDEEMIDAEKVNVELEEANQQVASAQVQDGAQATTTAAPAT
ncbi:hypothetical protein Tco_0825744, partial [Tanacetum coccineum]